MQKINVVGTSGSGKSTFASSLAARLGYEYIELDALFWLDDWQEKPDAELFSDLQARLDQSSWVLDGNYTRTIPIKWREVDTVIWLNYPFSTVLIRAIKRALTRGLRRKKLWNTNNTESIARLFTSDSIVWWTIKTYHKNQRNYQACMQNPAYKHIHFIELTNPNAAKIFLESI